MNHGGSVCIDRIVMDAVQTAAEKQGSPSVSYFVGCILADSLGVPRPTSTRRAGGAAALADDIERALADGGLTPELQAELLGRLRSKSKVVA